MQFTTVVLNLDSRPDRLAQVTEELENQLIKFERFSAVKHEIGYKGYNASIKGIFEKYKEVENLLIIEDDCYFEGHFYQSVLDELPDDYDGFWLGSNLRSVHDKHYNENISILEDGWTTHAVFFSKAFRSWCLENWDGELVFDEWVRVNALPVRKCYVLRPMIAFQRPSKSDITGGYADYTNTWWWAKKYLV
ncbi:hypothetical protein [Pedobacter sp.]|uniref:hypothetical protein n=1 Tax=Pedobacter sp. TaxID=1411316 RepID=UPI003C610508